MVPRGGIEPPWDFSRQILSLMRLPISPPRHTDIIDYFPILVYTQTKKLFLSIRLISSKSHQKTPPNLDFGNGFHQI